MSLLSVLEAIAHKLPFSSEDEKTAFHEQIHALGDEAVSDVKTLVHGVETDAVTDAGLAFHDTGGMTGGTPTVTPTNADPLAGLSDAELEAEIAKRKAAAGQ